MSKVLFINGTAHGHLNPTFPLVHELSRRGEDVIYFSTKEFQSKIEASGARFLDYGDELGLFFKNFKPSGNHPFYTLIEFLLAQDMAMSHIILEKTKGMHFDYIIHDAMMGGGNIVTRQLGIPAICSCTSFTANKLPVPPSMLARGFHPQLDRIYQQAEAAGGQPGVLPDLMDIFFKKENLNIVFTSRLFQPGGEGYDSSFQFVGPSMGERGDDEPGLLDGVGDRPLVYISMGTINNSLTLFYKYCMEAFSGEASIVVLSVGTKVDINSLGAIPQNFIVRNTVPQLQVLKRANAFISHGGLNSVSEALYYGVPIVAIPLANDQPMVARQLEALGAGIELKMQEITPVQISDAVHKVISDPAYQAASKNIGRSFAEAGGCMAAADSIYEYKMKLGL
jgi:MGT family glycosyltransferase